MDPGSRKGRGYMNKSLGFGIVNVGNLINFKVDPFHPRKTPLCEGPKERMKHNQYDNRKGSSDQKLRFVILYCTQFFNFNLQNQRLKVYGSELHYR